MDTGVYFHSAIVRNTVLESLTEEHHNRLQKTLVEFTNKYIEATAPFVFSIAHLTPKEKLYLKFIGYKVENDVLEFV